MTPITLDGTIHPHSYPGYDAGSQKQFPSPPYVAMTKGVYRAIRRLPFPATSVSTSSFV